jgi:hypothetical protein
MNKTINQIRLFLFTCSGEDNFILKRCNGVIQMRFAVIGVLVLLIFVGCFFSATLFSYSLFQGAKWASIPIGIFWGAMVVNIYLLLLHTISPTIIPLSSKKKRKNSSLLNVENEVRFLTLSMFLRIGFMMLLAIIIAQPLNFSILSSTVKTHLLKHKIQERVKLYALTNSQLIKEELVNQKEFNKKIRNKLSSDDASLIVNHLTLINDKITRDGHFLNTATKELNKLDKIDCHVFLNKTEKKDKLSIINNLEQKLNDELASDKSFINNLNTVSISGILQADYENLKLNLSSLVTEKIDNYNKHNNLLNKSNFYIKTIQLLLIENPLSWIITLLVCLAFLTPIYLKYKVRDISTSMFKSEENEPKIVRLREELINTKDFNWLENKIKSTNIKNIRTSDYYFQRMLVEHKIILEEYDQSKKMYSEKLTANIKQYNTNSLKRLIPQLEKLKKVNLTKYQEFYTQIIHEYKNEIVIKYEYWLDCPFRTKKINKISVINNEIGLLDFVYNQTNEDEII